MKSGLLHRQATSDAMSADLCYELDAERYPSLANEFFTNLRQKYPRAFRRTVASDAGKSSVAYSTSSEDSESVWSLWDCQGEEDHKVVLMETGGALVPRSDLTVNERLKRISDSFSSVKSTGGDLVTALRNLRSEFLADDGDLFSSRARPGNVIARDSFYGCTDAASNPTTSNSVSRNSLCETRSLCELSKESTVPRIVSVQSASCDMQQGVLVDAVSDIDATLNNCNAGHDIMPVQSIDASACTSNTNSALLEEDAGKQLACADKSTSVSGDIALHAERDQSDTNQGLVKSAV